MRPGTNEGACALIGQVVDGKYEVLRLVGEGAMGAVYEARHLIIGRRVALKILHARLAEYPEMMQRFLQEARVAGSLGHGNICEVTDLGMTEEGQPFLVLPFLEGRSLREEQVRHLGRLATDRVFDILCQVMVALQRAHEMNVVHRDLKPENIFLTQMGERGDFVKVLDFGISKVMARDATDTPGLTVTGAVLGTPYYMSPEQARGVRDVDFRVDVYAVAVLAFELLTGQRPFEGKNYNEVIYRIGTEPFPDAHAVDPAVPQTVADVIRRGGARASGDRWSSLRDFRRALVTAALDAGLRLPGYLSHPDVTGEVALLSAGDLAPRLDARARGAAPTVVGRSGAGDPGGAQEPARVDPAGAHERTVLGHPVLKPAVVPADAVRPIPAPVNPPAVTSDAWVDRPLQLAELAPPPVPRPGPSRAERLAARLNPPPAAPPAPADPWADRPIQLADLEPPAVPGPGPSRADRTTPGRSPAAPASPLALALAPAPPRPPAAAAPRGGILERPPSPRSHAGPVPIALAIVVVLAAGLGGAWWYLRPDRGARRPGTHAEVSVSSLADRDRPAPPVAGHVRIYFRVEPPDSVLTFRGRTTREKVLTLPRSSQPVQVKLHARLYQPQELTVVPDRDRTVLVNLSRR